MPNLTARFQPEPTLESYRLSHQPRPGYGPVFICPFVVLTDSAGQLYNAMRGVQGQNKRCAPRLRRTLIVRTPEAT